MSDHIDDIVLTEEGARMAAKWEGGLLLRPALGHITENGFEWYSESQQANILREYEGARMAERLALAEWLDGLYQVDGVIEERANVLIESIMRGEHLGEVT
jgi:hypothetical protein